MKTIFSILVLACAGLWAQTTFAQEAPPGSTSSSNLDEALRTALRRAMKQDTGLVAQAAATNPAPAPVTPRFSAPPIPAFSSTNTNVVVPVTVPAGTVTVPAVPATVTPPPATVVPSTTIPPGAGTAPAPVPAAAAVPSVTPPGGAPVVTAPPTAPPSTSPATDAPEEMIPAGMINFQAVPIDQVLTIYAEFVNRTILRPTTLPAPVITLKTQTPLTKRETIAALDAVLGMNGIAMVNIGDKFVKASLLAQAGNMGAPRSSLTSSQLPDLGAYVTHVVQLKYARPTEMVSVLQPFASAAQNAILPIDSSQMLVLRDFAENVKRMLEMIAEIDVAIPPEFESEVIPIKYALASEIANALNSLSSGGGGTTVGGGTTGGTPGAARSTGTRMGSGMSRPGSTGYPGQQPGMMSPQAYGQPTTPGVAPGGSSFTDRLQNIIRRASVSGDIQVLGQTKIIADERTNALLIYAGKEDMKIIKDIVAKLDVVLAQVLIEAYVVEVTLTSDRDLGVTYIEKTPHPSSGYFQGLGAINNGTSFSPSPLISATTNVIGGLPGGFSYLATFGNDLDVTITAMQNDSRARILQRPRIQTSHAVQATLFTGQSRPYPTGSYYGGGSFGGYSSIQQLQIGVTLDVTPLINPDGLVVMDIHQTIESYNGDVRIENVGDVPITSRKEAAAKVAVRDRDTIILGGLIEVSKSRSTAGVPLLKDLPLLGYLFRSTGDMESRSELIVLIRPTVLPTPEIAALTAKAEKDKMPGVRRAEAELMREELRHEEEAQREAERTRETDAHTEKVKQN